MTSTTTTTRNDTLSVSPPISIASRRDRSGRIVNGQKVTVTEKTAPCSEAQSRTQHSSRAGSCPKVRKPDGTVETTRSESKGDGNGTSGAGQAAPGELTGCLRLPSCLRVGMLGSGFDSFFGGGGGRHPGSKSVFWWGSDFRSRSGRQQPFGLGWSGSQHRTQ